MAFSNFSGISLAYSVLFAIEPLGYSNTSIAVSDTKSKLSRSAFFDQATTSIAQAILNCQDCSLTLKSKAQNVRVQSTTFSASAAVLISARTAKPTMNPVFSLSPTDSPSKSITSGVLYMVITGDLLLWHVVILLLGAILILFGGATMWCLNKKIGDKFCILMIHFKFNNLILLYTTSVL